MYFYTRQEFSAQCLPHPARCTLRLVMLIIVRSIGHCNDRFYVLIATSRNKSTREYWTPSCDWRSPSFRRNGQNHFFCVLFLFRSCFLQKRLCHFQGYAYEHHQLDQLLPTLESPANEVANRARDPLHAFPAMNPSSFSGVLPLRNRPPR